MREIATSDKQYVINKIKAREDFTYPEPTQRYVVGTENLFTGTNPSLTSCCNNI